LTSNMHNRQLPGQHTLLASDPIWMKPCVPGSGLPTPILPRNEPSISTTLLGEDINNITPRSTPRSLPHSFQLPSQPAEVDNSDTQIMLDVSTSVTPNLGLQVSISVLKPSYFLDHWHLRALQLVGLSRQDTLPVSDPIWMKSPCVPGIPTPIPPRNEPLISTYIMSVVVPVDDIDSSRSLPKTLQPTESVAPGYS
jgi:hypothetical protein